MQGRFSSPNHPVCSCRNTAKTSASRSQETVPFYTNKLQRCCEAIATVKEERWKAERPTYTKKSLRYCTMGNAPRVSDTQYHRTFGCCRHALPHPADLIVSRLRLRSFRKEFQIGIIRPINAIDLGASGKWKHNHQLASAAWQKNRRAEQQIARQME